jgi:hypothetical protein
MIPTGTLAERMEVALRFALQHDHGWLSPTVQKISVDYRMAERLVLRGPVAGYSLVWTLDMVLLRYARSPTLLLARPVEQARLLVDACWEAAWSRATVPYMVTG